MKIEQGKRRFLIDPRHPFSVTWYTTQYADWEPESFAVLEQFLKPEQDFIEIGTWIGPLTLYAASVCRHIYALEPDPIAFEALQLHLRFNGFRHISLFPWGLAERSGPRQFGGNGEWGNSESTLLVNEAEYLNLGGEQPHWKGNDPQWRAGEQQSIQMTTFSEWIEVQEIELSQVSLIKMDIEGSEKYALPNLLTAVQSSLPPLYLSLHWDFLKYADIALLLQQLYSTYSQIQTLQGQPLSQSQILEQRISSLLALA